MVKSVTCVVEELKIADNAVEFRVKRLQPTLSQDLFSALAVLGGGIGLVFLLRYRSVTLTSAIGAIIVICYYFYRSNLVIEESLQIIDRFGVQVRVKYLSGREKTKFIEKDRIESIFLHEYIRSFEVHFSIAIMVRNEKKMVLIYEDAYPGYIFLKRVLNACNEFVHAE